MRLRADAGAGGPVCRRGLRAQPLVRDTLRADLCR